MLENILKGIKNISLKIAPYMLFGAAALPTVVGLGGGCDDKPKNRAPVITTTSIPDAQENQIYNTPLSATDKEGDAYTFSKVSGPSWMNVSTNGSLTGTPGDLDAGNTDITVEVEDTHSNTANKTFYFDVINTPVKETIKVGDIYEYGFVPVENVRVTIDGSSDFTNSDGMTTIDVYDGGTYTMFLDKTGYHSYDLDVDVSKTDNAAHLEYIIKEDIGLDKLYGDVFNTDGIPFPSREITGYLQKPNFETMNIYIDTTNAPDNASINQIVNILENEFPIISDNNFNATILNGRIKKGTTPPIYGLDNNWLFYWGASNGHAEILNSSNPDLITSGGAVVKPTADIGYYREESAQTLLGARSDSDIVPSTKTIFNTGAVNGITDYTTEDKKIILRAMRRPISSGNK